MQTKIVDKIFSQLDKDTIEAKTELEYINHFTLLVSVILSAQATDKSVNKATKDLFISYNTPSAILSLGLEGLKSYIRTIGLFNVKAKNIIECCKVLISNYAGEVPNNFEDLIKLPGVGRKTANVILNCAYGQETIAVDIHVYRVSRRIGLSRETNIIALEHDLLKIVPKVWLFKAHHLLILHGRYICVARKPKCSECGIKHYCNYYAESLR